MFWHYRKLIDLRRRLPIITTGRFELVDRDHPRVFAYWRHGMRQALLVVVNFYGEEADFALPVEIGKYQSREILVSNDQDAPAEAAGVLSLRPFEAVVYALE